MLHQVGVSFDLYYVALKHKIKIQLDALIYKIYFWNKTLHVSESSSVHHQEFFTVHTAMVIVKLLVMDRRNVRNL